MAMTEAKGPGHEGREGRSPCHVLNADLALLMCARAWGLPAPTTPMDAPESTAPEPSSAHSPWAWLDPSWRDRMETARATTEGAESPVQALHLLRGSHRFQCRADPGRVHPSWFERALQDESPAVRRMLASQAHRPSPPGSPSPAIPSSPCKHSFAFTSRRWQAGFMPSGPNAWSAASRPVVMIRQSSSRWRACRTCNDTASARRPGWPR